MTTNSKQAENLIAALYTLAAAYAELADAAMLNGNRDEVFRCTAAERAALNKARKLEIHGNL